MKRFLMVIISLSFCTLFTEIYAQNQKNKVLFKNVIIRDNDTILYAPFNGNTVASLYDTSTSSLLLFFEHSMTDVQVVITKDCEDVANDFFYISEKEYLECDMLECESGEYTISVLANGQILMTKTFYI